MRNRTAISSVLLAVVVVIGMTAPAVALSTHTNHSSDSDPSGTATAMAAQDSATQNDSSVNVTVGQQLSTVIDASSDEVQTDFENTAFEISVENATAEEQAEVIADRADELRDRSEAIHADYEEATEAYTEGKISKSEYAQRLATLNARATNLRDSYEQLQQRAANVSALELRVAGVNQTALTAAVENLSRVNGSGAAALLRQFTGESQGKIELVAENGLSIEVASEDGEQSREFERPRDDNNNITVTQSEALETARAVLSTPANGSWVLTESKVTQEGAYEFAFALQNTSNLTGEAEVSVDGSTGEVFALTEESEAREDTEADEEDDDREGKDRELAIVITEGTPAPNATVTLQVLADGESAENVIVYLNDRVAGTTGANGTVTVTLPPSGEAELTAQRGSVEGELEFEFEEDDEDDEVFRKLNVDATLDGDTVTVAVSYNGSGVENASVYASDQPVETTNSDGTVTFTIDTNETEELELEVVKGAFEAELAYVVQDNSLTLTEEAHEGDGDKVEQEEEDEEETTESEEEGTESEEEDEEETTETESEEEDEKETTESEDEQETESEEEETTETESEDEEA